MSSTKRSLLAAGVALAIGLGPAAVLLGTAAGAAEEGGPPQVTNRETVNLKADASGAVDVARIYDQIAVTGKGSVTLDNPISCENIRNLNGWGAPECADDQFTVTIDADGQSRYRTTSDFTKDLPFAITGSWKLDGESISPADLVGKSGEVEVTYRIENTSGQLTKLTFEDGTGAEVTKEEMVYTPLAGSLSLTLPPNYTNVAAPTGVVAADGRNASKLSFSATLIPPLGGPVVEVGYTADVVDATVPPANFSVSVVRPYDNPSVSSASESFAGGAETGQTLVAGATTIDENLLKLSTGAGTLLAGLLQLKAGAETLNSGLQDAADGSAELADGSAQLAEGLNGTAVPGSQKLADGAKQVAGGLLSLQASLTNLPAAVKATPEYQKLIGALSAIQMQIGSPSDTGTATALGALNTIGALMTGATVNGTTALTQFSTLAVILGCDPTFTSPAGCPQVLLGIDALTNPAAPGAPSATDLLYQVGATSQIAAGLKLKLYDTSGGQAGCLASPPSGCGAYQALDVVKLGIGQLVDAIAAKVVKDPNFIALVAGGQQVSAGAQQLASGLAPAAAGATTIADGNEQLAEGLGEAAEGTPQLAEGLGTASGGVPQIVDGTKQLSAEGTQKLIEAGNDTAMDFGLRFAIIEASAETTKDGGLPYGAPEEAELASAAYSMDLAGEGSTGGSDPVKGIAALVILGGAAAVGAAIAARR